MKKIWTDFENFLFSKNTFILWMVTVVAAVFMKGFLLTLLFLFVYLYLIGYALWFSGKALIFFIQKRKEKQLRNGFPLLLNVLFCTLIIINPLGRLLLHTEFPLKEGMRMHVVEMVQKNELKAQDYDEDVLKLPFMYTFLFLSDGNEVIKMGDKILFFEMRGMTDNMSGYIYSPKGTKPTKEDVYADIIYLKKINQHWYYIETT